MSMKVTQSNVDINVSQNCVYGTGVDCLTGVPLEDNVCTGTNSDHVWAFSAHRVVNGQTQLKAIPDSRGHQALKDSESIEFLGDEDDVWVAFNEAPSAIQDFVVFAIALDNHLLESTEDNKA